MTLALLRYTVGAVFFLPAVLRYPWRGLPGTTLLSIAVLGTLQFGVVTVSLNWSLEFVSAGAVALLFSLMPALTLVIGWRFRRETPSRWKIVGVALSFGAVALFIGETGIQLAPGGENWIGDSSAMGGTLIAAVCAILYRPLLNRTAILPLGGIAMLSAALVLAPLVLALHPAGLVSITAGGWWILLILGACSAASYGLWLWALMHASPTRVTVFAALSPVVAIFVSMIWLGEMISGVLIIPLLIMVLGLWVTHLDVAPVSAASS